VLERIGATYCYTGVFSSLGTTARHVALITHQAKKRLAGSTILSQPWMPEKPQEIAEAGQLQVVEFEVKPNWISLGLFCDQGDKNIYMTGNRALISVAPGRHRRAYFLARGINISSEVETFPEDIYCAMISRLLQLKDPKLQRVVKIGFSETTFLDSSTETSTGTHWIFSVKALEKWSRIAILPTLDEANQH